jgi:hypothetical protein
MYLRICRALGSQKLLGSTNCKSGNCKKVCGLQIGNPQIAKSIWAANTEIRKLQHLRKVRMAGTTTLCRS